MDIQERYKVLCPGFEAVTQIRPALRVNTLKINDKELILRLEKKKVTLEKIPYLSHGHWYAAPFSLGATPEYLQGYYYLQEAASQLPAQVLHPQPGETVLDMSSAPGGKLTQLAAMMQNKGLLIGLDTDAKRLEATRNNCARLGVTNAVLYVMDGRDAKKLGMTFDKILLDAPCSGNYIVEKDYFKRRRMQDFENRARLQKELLKAAFSLLKPKGTLVYSTCSLEPEEDEQVVDWAVRELGAVVEPITLSIGDPGLIEVFGKKLNTTVANCKRFWPHKTGTQGFFVANLSRP
ncbi:MAG: RsmB/NOP family class I SAM-dependent RNA methyltransferase [Nanoarchaeota archaeon]